MHACYLAPRCSQHSELKSGASSRDQTCLCSNGSVAGPKHPIGIFLKASHRLLLAFFPWCILVSCFPQATIFTLPTCFSELDWSNRSRWRDKCLSFNRWSNYIWWMTRFYEKYLLTFRKSRALDGKVTTGHIMFLFCFVFYPILSTCSVINNR